MAMKRSFQLFYFFLAVGALTPSLLMSSQSSSSNEASLGNVTNVTNITNPTNQSVTPAIFTSPATPISRFAHFNLSTNGTVCLYAYMECGVAYQFHKYYVPDSAEISGQCATGVNMTRSYVLLAWNDWSTNLTLKLGFKRFADSSWSISNVVVTIGLKGAKAVVMASENQSDIFHAPIGLYYHCSTSQSIKLNGGVTVDFKQVELQPFPNKKGEFGRAKECAHGGNSNNTSESNIVPIAVGCVLGGLIVILLITYLVGRAKRRGYEQM